MTPSILYFYAGRLIEEPEKVMALDGTYVCVKGSWFHFNHGMHPLVLDEVPRDIRLQAALITGEF